MNKMPTAEEFLKSKNYFDSDEYEDLIIEFAKLHVEAALKSASEKATYSGFNFASIEIDEDSILNAYPLDWIK